MDKALLDESPVQILVQPGQLLFQDDRNPVVAAPVARLSAHSPIQKPRSILLRFGRHGFRAVTVGGLAYFAGGAAGCGGADISDTLLTFSLP